MLAWTQCPGLRLMEGVNILRCFCKTQFWAFQAFGAHLAQPSLSAQVTQW